MGQGASHSDDSPKELSVSYLDVLNLECKEANTRDVTQQQVQCFDSEEVRGVPDDVSDDAALPKRLRSSANSECSTCVPSEDGGDCEVRTPAMDSGTPVLELSDDEVKVKLEPLLTEHLRECTYIIFDWDDTLLPTGFVMDVVKMLPPKYGMAALNHRGPRRGHVRIGGGGRVSKDFPCYEALKSHAALVARLLTAADRIARVAIVTSASRPWVFESAEQYLPGLDFAGLLKELRIPVYYAHEHQRGKSVAPDMDPGAACKQHAMAEFLQQASKDTSAAWNVISVGDSQAEKDAAKAVTTDFCDDTVPGKEFAGRPLCKTVKLMANPSLKHLSEELELLVAQLERLACHNGDFDLCVTEPDDLSMQADALLGA